MAAVCGGQLGHLRTGCESPPCLGAWVCLSPEQPFPDHGRWAISIPDKITAPKLNTFHANIPPPPHLAVRGRQRVSRGIQELMRLGERRWETDRWTDSTAPTICVGNHCEGGDGGGSGPVCLLVGPHSGGTFRAGLGDQCPEPQPLGRLGGFCHVVPCYNRKPSVTSTSQGPQHH